jgi:hypothetical protein
MLKNPECECTILKDSFWLRSSIAFTALIIKSIPYVRVPYLPLTSSKCIFAQGKLNLIPLKNLEGVVTICTSQFILDNPLDNLTTLLTCPPTNTPLSDGVISVPTKQTLDLSNFYLFF